MKITKKIARLKPKNELETCIGLIKVFRFIIQHNTCSTGPAVWFQKFEYAVSHWLQKTAEHVFGCVLCSPGCFSLFRAAALMDDNVMKRYSAKSMEPIHHIQYDQGD